MIIGSRIREQRKDLGLTQTELGDLIGVGKAAVCCYEKELRNPTLECIVKMVEIFQVSSDYLLGIEDLVKTFKKKKK